MASRFTSTQHRLRTRIRAFQVAFEGLWHVLRTQPHAWVHSLATLCVIGLSLWLGLSTVEWAILFLTIALVWVAEFINTAVEAIVDLTSPQPHPLAKIAKDVAAGAVLVAAIFSILIGLLILGPPLLGKLEIRDWRLGN